MRSLTEMKWHPIETVPQAGRVDLYAKRWDPKTDEFEYRRFADCFRRAAYFAGLDKGWHATHWMPAPPPPAGLPTDIRSAA